MAVDDVRTNVGQIHCAATAAAAAQVSFSVDVNDSDRHLSLEFTVGQYRLATVNKVKIS